MLRTSLYASALALILGGILFLPKSPQDLLNRERILTPTATLLPYAKGSNAATQYFDELGKLSYSFNAETLEHYRIEEGDDITEQYTLIMSPKLTIYQNGNPWYVEALQGKVSAQGKQLELWDKVLIWQESAEGVDTRMQTEKLTINPIQKYAHTDAEVKIKSAIGEIKAMGMTADLKKKQIKLLSKVRGTHDPI